MELPNEKWDEQNPRMTGDISFTSIVVCLVILGLAVVNRYVSLY